MCARVCMCWERSTLISHYTHVQFDNPSINHSGFTFHKQRMVCLFENSTARCGIRWRCARFNVKCRIATNVIVLMRYLVERNWQWKLISTVFNLFANKIDDGVNQIRGFFSIAQSCCLTICWRSRNCAVATSSVCVWFGPTLNCSYRQFRWQLEYTPTSHHISQSEVCSLYNLWSVNAIKVKWSEIKWTFFRFYFSDCSASRCVVRIWCTCKQAQIYADGGFMERRACDFFRWVVALPHHLCVQHHGCNWKTPGDNWKRVRTQCSKNSGRFGDNTTSFRDFCFDLGCVYLDDV